MDKKTLIIAEKPNQAKDYAKALGNFSLKNGYLENEKYFITWCFGHLIQLETDDKYRDTGNWNKSYLPLIPEQYSYCIGRTGKETDKGKKSQVELIKTLMSKSNTIINATDADREGELIFLYLYNYLNCKLPYKRLWISSLTENDIKKGFASLLSSEDVKNLGKSGYARAITDWLVGVNGTQAATLQFGKGTLLTIGRVQTAILKIICERYLKNLNFKKSFTYRIYAEHNQNKAGFVSISDDIFEKKETAKQVLSKLSNTHICTDREDKIQKIGAPLLHSIDTLIIEANKKFGYTGQETLSCAQSLYEKKLTSYPRTDTQYINHENYAKIKTFLVQMAQNILNINYTFEVENPKSVNAQKLTGSHDAIVPTGQTSAIGDLSEKESNIFRLILHRCLESFSVPAEYKKQKFSFENNGVAFVTHTSKLVKAGWKNYSFQSSADEVGEEEQSVDLTIQKGDKVVVNYFDIKEIESKPPQLYTEATLTPDLTNIGKFLKEENPELLDSLKNSIDLSNVQIGTQATRPGIIERLKHLGFIEMKKNKFIPTEKGLDYYKIIKNLEVSNIATTAILEKKLKDLSDGTMSEKDFYNEIKLYTEKIVSDIFSIEDGTSPQFVNKSSGICICPKCQKGTIRVGEKSYFCSEYKNNCKFVISKTILQKDITEKRVFDLCTKKITKEIKGFVGKKGSFDAKLKLDDEFKVVFDFSK